MPFPSLYVIIMVIHFSSTGEIIKDQKKIDRINELYHKSKAEGLTEEELKEQKALRSEYIMAIRGSIRSQLNNLDI